MRLFVCTKKTWLSLIVLGLFTLLCFTSFSSAEEISPSKFKTIETNNKSFDVQYSPRGNYFAYRDCEVFNVCDLNYNIIWKNAKVKDSCALFKLSDFSNDDKYFVFGQFQSDNDIGILRISDGKIIQQLKEHNDMLRCVVFSPSGRYLASGGQDGSIILWKKSANDNYTKYQTVMLNNYVNTVSFSPDEKFLSAGGGDKIIRIWRLSDNAQMFQEINAHSDSIMQLAFSPNFKYLASASADQTIKIWNVNDDKFSELQTLMGHSNKVSSIAFSPDSKLLASGSYDQTIKLWEYSGTKFSPLNISLKGHINNVYNISFNSNGKYLASGSEDRTIVIWKMFK